MKRRPIRFAPHPLAVFLAVSQIHDWCADAVRAALGQRYNGMQLQEAVASLHSRPMGRAAASGAVQFLFSSPDVQVARAGWDACMPWWSVVPQYVDPRGWRMVSLKWWEPR